MPSLLCVTVFHFHFAAYKEDAARKLITNDFDTMDCKPEDTIAVRKKDELMLMLGVKQTCQLFGLLQLFNVALFIMFFFLI